MSPSKLLQDGTVISFDDETNSLRVLPKASVLIEQDRIAEIYEDMSQVSIPTDTEIIDVSGKIICPGFVNTHSHMWQTAYRTMAPNCTLLEYLFWPSPVGTVAKFFNPEDIYISCLEGYIEALNSGVTTIVEHAHQNWSKEIFCPGYDATVDAGARVWYCFAAIDHEDFKLQDQYEAMGTLRKRNDDPRGLVKLGLAWDTISYMNEEAIEHTKSLIKRLDLEAITIHYLGGPWFGGHTGASPTNAASLALQALDIPIIFSHGGFLTEKDKSALRAHNWNLSITPESEMHYGHGQKTSKDILDQASMGIDTNWTFSGDMITQGRMWLQSIRKELYQQALDDGKIPKQNPFDVNEAFLLLTRQGGQALRRDDLGVLKKGAKADIVCIDGNSPNMLGWTDPVAAVVLHANAGDVRDVMVDGEFRKREGKLVLKKGDWNDISERFAAAARRIQAEGKGKCPPITDTMMGMQVAEVEIVSTRRGDH